MVKYAHYNGWLDRGPYYVRVSAGHQRGTRLWIMKLRHKTPNYAVQLKILNMKLKLELITTTNTFIILKVLYK